MTTSYCQHCGQSVDPDSLAAILEPAARTSDPSTSHEAALVQPRSIQQGNDYGDTLIAFWQAYPAGLNASEVTWWVGEIRERRPREPLRSMHRRVSDLDKAGYLVHKGDLRASMESGRMQRVFELTVQGQAIAARLCEERPVDRGHAE